MKIQIILTFIYLISLPLSRSYAAEGAVNLYLRSFSSGQGLDVSLGSVPLNDLSKRGFGLSQVVEKVIEEGPSHTVVVLYIPKGLSEDEKTEYGDLIQKELSLAYPLMKFTVKYSFLDPIEGKQQMDIDNAEVERELISRNDATPEEKKLGRMMVALNKMKMAFNFVTRVADIRDTIKGLKSKSPKSRDLSIATAVGISKAGVNSYAWIATSNDPGASAYMSAVSSWALDIWFAKNSQKWANWKKSSYLSWNRFGFGPLAKLINKTEARRTWVVDTLNGFFWSHYFRTLAYMDNPSQVGSIYSQNGVETLWIPYTLSTLTGGPISAKSNPSIDDLRRKGRLSPKTHFYTFLAYDANFTASGFMLQKALMSAYWTLSIAEWSTRMGFITANVVLPARYKKLVMLDPRLSQMEVQGILHKEGIILPEGPTGQLSSEHVLKDWEMRSQTFRDPRTMDLMERGFYNFEKIVNNAYRRIVFANTQRVTGVDLLDINPKLDSVHQVCKNIFKF